MTDDGAPDLLAGLRTGAWLDRQTFAPLAHAVPGVIPEGMSLLVGPPKIGKSWFVLDMLLAVASGGKAWSALDVGEARPVLYLALEDGDRRMQDRCRRLLGTDPIPERFHYLTTVVPANLLLTIRAWLDLYGDLDPVVVLDTLGKVMPPASPGESAYGRDYRIASALKRLADDHPGSALVINHHDRKAGSDDFVESVSGTNGLAGAADTILSLGRPRQEGDGLLKVTSRDAPEGEYAMRLVGGCSWMVADGDLVRAAQRAAEVKAAANLGDVSAKVVRYLAAASAPVAPADVERDLKLPDARQYLRRLVESGRAVRLGRGQYTAADMAPHL